MEKPNKNCPNCQGAGEPQHSWNPVTREYEIAGVKPCAICYANFNEIRTFTENLILLFSGKRSTEMSIADQDTCFAGEDGARYRRLLNWLWTHPPDSGQDRNGHPLGEKRTKPKTFSQLFGHERKRKPRIPKLAHEGMQIIPWFAADVKALSEAWKNITKPVRKNTILPILQYVKASSSMDGLALTYTDLSQWYEACAPACVFSHQSMALPAHLIQKILKECDKRGIVAFGFDPAEEDKLTIIILHGNACWKIPVMPLDMYPVRTWPEAQEEREVA